VIATIQHSVDTSTFEHRHLEKVSDVLSLAPGQIAGLTGIPGSGLTRIGMSLLAPHAVHGPLVYLDVRGWASPMAAYGSERPVVVQACGKGAGQADSTGAPPCLGKSSQWDSTPQS
jgi:hypothetical protein